MDYQENLLDIANSYLTKFVAPIASEIDCNWEALKTALIGLNNLGLLALRVPKEWGGLEVSEEFYQDFQELVARYSGALAFLQTQHQSAVGMLVSSENNYLKQEYLTRISKGELLLGVGFSQLRRQGEPTITAIPVEGGYKLDGIVPWVTGWGLFQEFIVAASLPDGRAVFAVVPFVETYQDDGGLLTFSKPMELAAMNSTNTVIANFKNWFLSKNLVVFVKPSGWIHENDKKNGLKATALALGCALAGIDVLKEVATNKSLPFIYETFELLKDEFNQCKSSIRNAQKQHDIDINEKLQLRAWAIDLAGRCANAAVTASSGAANSKYHAAQRVYREALVFTVSGQTTALMEATLNKLVRKAEYRKEKEEPLLIQNLTKQKSINYSKVIHLSHVIDVDIPQWPNDPQVEFETVAEIDKDGYYLRRFAIGEHSATHINAPNSFHPNGVGIDKYLADSLVVSAVVIDISKQAQLNPDYCLSINDVLYWEEQNGEITANTLVLVYTGWQDKWLDKDAFFNYDCEGNMHFPGFSPDTTHFLIQSRNIAGVGIDTHGVDGGKDSTFTTNILVLERPRIVLENLTNLDKLPPTGTTLIIGLLRLKNGSGSPAGILALVP